MKGRRGKQKRQGRRAHHAGRAHGADDLHVLEADPLKVRVEVALVGDELLQERDQLHRRKSLLWFERGVPPGQQRDRPAW